jgi:hypothetical protein
MRHHSVASPAPHPAHRPQLRLGLRRLQRRGQGPPPRHPGRHPDLGIVTGPAGGFLLDDSSLLLLPARHEVAANKEIINGIGVAPDDYMPPTDLSAGQDPAIQKALTLLGSQPSVTIAPACPGAVPSLPAASARHRANKLKPMITKGAET